MTKPKRTGTRTCVVSEKSLANLRKGGSRKGIPNKITTAAKDAIQMAFDSIPTEEGDGAGQAAFAEWAQKNRGIFYTIVYVKLLPLKAELSGADGQALVPMINLTLTRAGE